MVSNPSHAEKLILVIDDDDDLRELYKDLLASRGFRCASARNGEDGLQQMRALRPDAVLLDMMMPDCDGLEFLSRLPTEVPFPLPPVVANSGFDLLEKEALGRGASVFLRKPVELHELVAVLRNLIAGEPPPLEALARGVDLTQAARQRARVRRKELWEQLDRRDPELQARLDSLVLRLAGYFASATALITLAKDAQIFVLASSGGDIASGNIMSREASFHNDVVEGGSSLILGDAAAHACFATHPGAQSGVRFFACAPLTGNDGIPIGTLSLQDRQPRVFQAEDLLILEHMARGVARRIEARAGVGMVGPYPFDEPGVFSREALLVLLGAELRRTARRGGVVDLALVTLETDEPALVRRGALAAYGSLGGERLAVATFGAGVLALLRGAGDAQAVEQRIGQALADLLAAGVVVGGTGRVTYSLSNSAALGATEVAQLADEARMRSVTLGAGVEHVMLSNR